MKIINSLPFLLFLSLFFSQAYLGSKITKPHLNVSMQDSAINFEESFSKFSTFGHGRFVGAITWVMTLLEGDLDHYRKRDGNSWMFHRFKSISIFDPLFYENYRFGGQYLSIIKDDIDGATRIYDKGLRFYPKDFELNYHAGFHYYFEAGQLEKAIKSYEKLFLDIEKVKKFPLMPSILAKLKVESGDIDSAFNGLKDFYNQLPESSRSKARLFDTLYSLKAKKDLKCLNGSGSHSEVCDKKDFTGELYQYKKGSYSSSKSLSKIMLNKKN
jgi:tetratricopeptide (TPR) repeat protein